MRYKTSLILAFFLAGCTATVTPASQTPVTLMLDWVPNTNHTGLFVAEQEGYFTDEGLQVEIVQPGEVYAEQAVAGGAADFGVSFQEQVTLARADGVPLVSIAAILQHNTSAFGAPSWCFPSSKPSPAVTPSPPSSRTRRQRSCWPPPPSSTGMWCSPASAGS